MPSADRDNELLRRLRRMIDVSEILRQSPIDLQILGRTVLHAALVGVLAGLAGSLFFFSVEATQRLLLERLAGYVPLRARGENVFDFAHLTPFRPWLLWLLPALGALAGGILTARLAPEAQGGGGDAAIDAFHRQGGQIRARVIGVKMLASVLTLGSGGAGGREGPIMQIGAALGATLARLLRVDARERRVLLVAGMAAGMAAVFRTPLGAALLAVEVLYHDDFESDALIPAVLASVTAYSVFISIFGESTLFGHAARYPLHIIHLPLYGLMALVVSLGAMTFIRTLAGVRRLAAKWPKAIAPALGGLVLGTFATLVIWYLGPLVGQPGQGMGILGSGYGAAQMAIVGASWLPTGWMGAELLLLLALVKIVAASLTIGSGGSAGDFAPSLVIGALLGGAFGQAARLVTGDASLDPGAFALVGMGAFYGGAAHVPISALIMVCELAGSYDLLVPLMLAEGVAFVALRQHTLYHAQHKTRRDSPAHRELFALELLRTLTVKDVMVPGRAFVSFAKASPASEIVAKIAETTWQDVFPVYDGARALCGVIDGAALKSLVAVQGDGGLAVAADVMTAPLAVAATDNLQAALEKMLAHDLRELPVVDDAGRVIGFIDEREITRAHFGVEQTPETRR